jgi:hypothetical protein
MPTGGALGGSSRAPTNPFGRKVLQKRRKKIFKNVLVAMKYI